MVEFSRLTFIETFKRFLKPILEWSGLGAWSANLYRWIIYLCQTELREKNARFYKQGAPDGLPLPSSKLIYSIMRRFEAELYWEQSVLGRQTITEILRKNQLELSSFSSILDFGCGCGRVMRQWKDLKNTALHGVDHNKRAIHWCRSALPFAQFQRNTINERLDFSDETFDLIYAISVFTHLDADLQIFWRDELSRVLKPGGYLLITVHGKNREHELATEDRERLEQDELVVMRKDYSGLNYCSVYHPESYLRNVFAENLEFIDYLPDGAIDVKQDAVLLRKPVS